MRRLILSLFLLGFFCSYSFSEDIFIPVETSTHAIVFQVTENNHVKIIYNGRKFKDEAEYVKTKFQYNLTSERALSNNNIFVAAGTDNNFIEPAIAVVHSDGNNSLDLVYEKHTVNLTTDDAYLTVITLKDAVYPFYVDLYYKAWKNVDVIEQWSVIRHKEKGIVLMNKYASANLYFFDKNYYLTSYNNNWAKEMQPEITPLKEGIHDIQSRLGTRTNLFSSQNFMISFENQATEDNGTVLLGQLAWNGNFLIQFEIDEYKNLHLIAGINPYQSASYLKPNTDFETPKFVYTISYEGIGKGSQNLHNWLCNYNLKKDNEDRMTLLNNWEATYFDFDENKLVNLIKGAKELGVDMFLLDDGWFGNKYPRNNDNAGLGDWQANKVKLPNGIPFLVKAASNEGIKFGLWIEPEMVNPKSELYEQHPQWVLKEEKRPEIYFRNQLVLDLTNPEVQEFVFNVVDQIMTENPQLAFFKWDCNAPIFNGHSFYLEKNKIPQSHLYVEYTKGLYKVLERIEKKYPQLFMMLCSGGAGRTDYTLFKYFTEFWLSDNTDPLERVFIQWNFSYYYPAITMCNHVTNWSNKSLKYRIDVASMGKLGFDIRVDELSPENLAFCKQTIENYNSFKEIVWKGNMFRLVNPYENDLASLMYVNGEKTKAVMFNYLTNWRFIADAQERPIKMKGLNPQLKYRIKEINLYENQKSTLNLNQEYSGDFLMNVGYNPQVSLSRTSVVLLIEAI